MSLFSAKQKPLVGVDIGQSSIKIVELSRSGGRGAGHFRLERFGIGSVPAGVIDGRHVTDSAALGNALKATLKAAGFKAKRAAVAVAGSSVISTTLTLPAGLGEREMEALVQLEADQYIPYSLEEVKIDFEVLGPTANAADNVDVLLAACHSENVDERVAVLRAAALEPAVVDVEAFAIENACERLSDDWPAATDVEAIAVADIGAYTTSVIVVQSGRVVYTREQNIGGARLTEDIQHRYGMDAAGAEEAKLTGALPDGYAEQVRQPFIEAMAQEIRGALQFYHAAGTGEDVSRVWLTGGGAALADIARIVSRQTGVAAKVFNPFVNVELSAQVPVNRLKEAAPALAVACGLALRSFDV
jgi:type IV pilus assembly protein PilM